MRIPPRGVQSFLTKRLPMVRAVVLVFAFWLLAPLASGADDAGAKPQSDEEQAVALAKQRLSETLRIAADQIELRSVEVRTWNDSSLGCGRPGEMAMQVITHGYAVTLTANGREHTVHVAGANAIVCDRPRLIRKELRPGTHARGLDVMVEQARQDLAAQLGTEPSQIRILGMTPQQWSDSAMECPEAGEDIVPGPIRGYRISLGYKGRVYTYHTDMKTVRACPRIESA